MYVRMYCFDILIGTNFPIYIFAHMVENKVGCSHNTSLSESHSFVRLKKSFPISIHVSTS